MQSTKHFIKSEEDARLYLENSRWHGEPRCPRCNNCKVTWYADRQSYMCKVCRKPFSVRTGTMMECSRISLLVWVRAIDIVTRDPNIRPARLSDILSINYRTAKKLIHRIKTFYKLP